MTRPALAFLRKDMRITRVFWAPMAFSYVVFLLTAVENAGAYLAIGSSLATAAAAVALGIDDRYRSGPMYAALPATRRDQVAGRYIAWGLGAAACLALFLATTAALDAAAGWRSPQLGSLLSVKGGAAFLLWPFLAGIVFLPLQFRLGFWRGAAWFFGAGVPLGIAVLSAAARLAPAEALASVPVSAAPPAVATAVRGVRALAWLAARLAERPAGAAAVAAGLVFVSFRLSVRFFEKRDL